MKYLLTLFLSCAIAVSTANALAYDLSASLDALQSSSNGGFGSFDTGAGSGTGSFTGTYDDATNQLNYTLTFANLTSSVTAIHMHGPAAPGVNAGVQVAGFSLTSPSSSGAVISDGQESDLLNNLWYVNIHTINYGGGEIRGQIIASPVPEPATYAAVIGLCSLGAVIYRRRRPSQD